MLSDEQLWSVFREAVNAWLGSSGGSYSPANTAGLRAVEAAVRADQAIECNNDKFDRLRQLAAAQAVIATHQKYLGSMMDGENEYTSASHHLDTLVTKLDAAKGRATT